METKKAMKTVGMSASDYKYKYVKASPSFYKRLGAKRIKG
jgi:hypothetical protein